MKKFLTVIILIMKSYFKYTKFKAIRYSAKNKNGL